jgi:Raf kinase inhibitor-like YbhB/YbcL family protein
MKHWIPIRWRSFAGVLFILVGALLTSGCGTSSAPPVSVSPVSPVPSPTGEVPKTIVLTSSAFRDGDAIPSLYTCTGAGTSPPLEWSHVPIRTASFLLIMEDVSGGGFTHWVLFNVPSDTRRLLASVPHGGQLATGARQGINDAGGMGYLPPCPYLPRGATDNYQFMLYALDTILDVAGGASEQDVLAASGGHMLAKGELEGSYMLPQTPSPNG